jgi:hypothetical protein
MVQRETQVIVDSVTPPVPTGDTGPMAEVVAAPDRGAAMLPEILAICAELDALDTEIATLEPQVAELPAVLAALAGHPALWLLLGRAGIDRPGGLGAVVGQQIVTVTRVNRRLLLVVAALMLFAGLAVGLGISIWLHGRI